MQILRLLLDWKLSYCKKLLYTSMAGEDRRIHHGINLAHNAIYTAGKPGHQGCGILDTDLIAAFDLMCLDWVCMVLAITVYSSLD